MYESNVRQGEFGLAIGAGHYFGDLNTRAALNRPKFSAGAFYIKQFNNYVGLKIAANYARLGYSDIYSKNETQHRRNLSFNSNIWEFSVSGQFNFFHFMPGVEGYNFTPYVSLASVFSLTTHMLISPEPNIIFARWVPKGRAAPLYPDRKQYSTIAGCIPLSVGLKYALTEGTNFFAEIGYRFTTDRLPG